MMPGPVILHGGALDAALALYGGTRQDWLDLSTGINPVPPKLRDLPDDAWTRLPERNLDARAVEAARRFYGASEDAGIVAGPGSQALISALPHLFAPTIAAVVGPTYSEHRIALEAAGHRVVEISTPHEAPREATILVVVNPNNPDGRLHPAVDLMALGEEMAARGGLLIVDEAFMDVRPAESVAPFAGRAGLLVHRSFGKFFGLAGLRLGFALTTPALAARLASRLGPWAVSGPALHVGADMLEASDRQIDIRLTIERQADTLRKVLQGAGLEIVGGTALFALVRHDRAADIHLALCRRHILTRPFSYRADWLRIGNVPGTRSADRLEAALQDVVGAGPAAP